ncbi:MAG: 1-deoxy-D-xylulose-5-phosphate reductoisomerase [Coriobacteriales bacterium]|jgi:1-deoxy-D-xylulose-5-phosphate reductoisomerase|nr:1-deoxy-D-xylulose-5-phosphate reductoisomerase [Coriobacteriales bacterium]
MPLKVAILGATGSIGRQALDVARQHGDAVQVVALAAGSNFALLAQQALEFDVSHIALGLPAADAGQYPLPAGCVVGFGGAAITALGELPQVDVVLNALVGFAGLRVSHAALAAGKVLALANKESLVVGGDLLMPMATAGQLLPVDSEHSAIFQCLAGEPADAVARIWLTASGGPFYGLSREELAGMSAAQALAHPTWQMGAKISIDSATLMNKGLEVIEAHHLFAIEYSKIEVVVHPQSCIHSMVEYADGSVKAHLGVTDMRVPIQYALSYPQRWAAPVQPLDFRQLADLSFAAPDMETFKALRLALAAGESGGTLPCALNAANEVAVAAFLAGDCGFLDIERVVEQVLEQHQRQEVESLEQLEAVDAEARAHARELL